MSGSRESGAMNRRIWLVALSLYGLAAAADVAMHLGPHRHPDHGWLTPAHLAVAVAAGIFWPIDLVAQLLLSR